MLPSVISDVCINLLFACKLLLHRQGTGAHFLPPTNCIQQRIIMQWVQPNGLHLEAYYKSLMLLLQKDFLQTHLIVILWLLKKNCNNGRAIIQTLSSL